MLQVTNLKLVRYLKATYLRGFLLFLLFAWTASGFSQLHGLKHFQKKYSLETVVLPCDAYESEAFGILFPDSIYSGGTITVKKLLLGDLKISCFLEFDATVYNKVYYTIKKKDCIRFETMLLNRFGVIKISDKMIYKEQAVIYKKEPIGSKQLYILQIAN